MVDDERRTRDATSRPLWELHVHASRPGRSAQIAPSCERACDANEADWIDVRDADQVETDIHDRIGQGSDPTLDSRCDDVAEQADDIDRRAMTVRFTLNLKEIHSPSGFSGWASSPARVTLPAAHRHATVTLRDVSQRHL
jgi:hypothetical protein